jgi:chemotaxis protein MotA
VAIALRDQRRNLKHDIEELVRLSRLWMRGDLRAVEEALESVTNPFLRTGVQMIIDRVPDADIEELLQWRIARMRAREAAESQMFRVMATYAPAFGMIGTLIGLINLVAPMGEGDMQGIGQQLGVALITTFYGVLLANLVFKPIALRLERRTDRRLVVVNMIMEGLSMMTARRSPAMMEETLKAFIAHIDDEISDAGASNGPPRPQRPAPESAKDTQGAAKPAAGVGTGGS